METFEEYLHKMGYGWNDFDRTHEMENLIEQYADERVRQALTIPDVVKRSEQLPCDCVIGFEGDIPIIFEMCDNCKTKI